MIFKPLPPIEEVPADERKPNFQSKLQFAIHSDLEYQVKLKEIRSEDQVDEVIHKDIYVDSTEMESNIDSELFYNNLINFDVITDSKKIGRIENINSKLPQPVFEIIYDSRKVLIPIHEDLIKKIDKKNKIIYLDIPNGLLEII